MVTQHFSDEEIQAYAADPGMNEIAAAHLSTCDQCSAALNNYRLLFTVLKEQPSLFKFNLSGMIMPQLRRAKLTHKEKYGLVTWLFLFAALVGLFSCYLFKAFLSDFFPGMKSIAGYLPVVIVFVIVCFQGYEQYRNYERKMRALDYY